MEIIRDPKEMQRFALQVKREGRSIGVVPTMGFLHEGHLSLMRLIRSRCDVLVVTIFVNPTQFNQAADLDSYPRDEEGDLRKCRENGADLVFSPEVPQMYPEGFQSEVRVEEISQGLCGATRPGHMQGVSTVVTKLFNLTQPDIAAFGKKDYQQWRMIRRMVQDLDFPIEIVGGDTYREADGLAMSSRNANLDAKSRKKAVLLSQTLQSIDEEVKHGETDCGRLTEKARKTIENAGDFSIDYLEIRSREQLTPLETISEPAVVLVAAFIGGVRLIDNLELTWKVN